MQTDCKNRAHLKPDVFVLLSLLTSLQVYGRLFSFTCCDSTRCSVEPQSTEHRASGGVPTRGLRADKSARTMQTCASNMFRESGCKETQEPENAALNEHTRDIAIRNLNMRHVCEEQSTASPRSFA